MTELRYGPIYQARYDEEGRPEVAENIKDLDMVIKDGELTHEKPPSAPTLTQPPVEEDTGGVKKRAQRRKKKEEPVKKYVVTLSGSFGEAKVTAVGISQPLDTQGIALVLLSGPDGFAFVPPPSSETFKAVVEKRTVNVIHVGLRTPSPTGEGELLILLGVDNE